MTFTITQVTSRVTSFKNGSLLKEEKTKAVVYGFFGVDREFHGKNCLSQAIDYVASLGETEYLFDKELKGRSPLRPSYYLYVHTGKMKV